MEVKLSGGGKIQLICVLYRLSLQTILGTNLFSLFHLTLCHYASAVISARINFDCLAKSSTLVKHYSVNHKISGSIPAVGLSRLQIGVFHVKADKEFEKNGGKKRKR